MPVSLNNNDYQNNPYYNIGTVNMGNVDASKTTETLKKTVASNPAVSKVENGENDPKTLLLTMLPIWLGLGQTMDYFNKKCAGKYEESIVGKIGTRFDSFGQNNVFKSQKIQTAEKGLQQFKKWFNTKIIDKSPILTAFTHTPTGPECSMAKVMARGTIGELANDAVQITKEYLKQPMTLQDLGVNEKTIKAMEQIKVKDPTRYAKIIEKMKLRSIGLNTKTWAKIEKDALNSTDDIIKAFNKVDPTKSVRILGKIPVLRNIIGREVHFSAVANKLQALKGMQNGKQVTALGKAGTKGILRSFEGLTNGTAGGKFVILMQAYIFADALLRAAKAPKGEKVSTFMESVMTDTGMYLMIPWNIKMLHRFGGFKYIGMTKEQVALYRNNLAEFNKNVTNGTFSSAKEYKAGRDALKAQLKGNSKWYHKPFKALGKFINIGNEKLKPFKATKGIAKAGNIFKKAGYWFKNAAGYPVRLLAVGMLIAPLVSKIFTKASHLIFGRPTKSLLDKEETPKENTAEVINPMTPQEPVVDFDGQQTTLNPQNPDTSATATSQAPQKPTPVITPVQPQGESLIDMYDNNKKKYELEDERTYIPSSDPVVLQENAGMDKITAALMRADKAEQEAMRMFNGG